MGVERLRFPEAIGAKEAREIRRYETEDIVTRFGVISPERIILNNYPVSNPASIFNASVIYNHEDDTLRIFARVIFGYYMYVSSIVGIDVPLNDVLNRYVNINRYTGNMIIYPSTRYDVWGAEDPRVYELNGKLYMTYVGRTINYFNAMIRRNRTIPITAIYDDDLRTWIKRFVISLSPEVFGEVISNKNAFFHLSPDGSLFFLHRPHLSDESFHLVASLVSDDDGLVVRVRNAHAVVALGESHYVLGLVVLRADLPRLRLGDVPVLAVDALEVARNRRYAERPAPRPEVKEGLLLDGVVGEARELPVDEGVQLPFPILPYVAEAHTPRRDLAGVRAELAHDRAVLERHVVEGLPDASVSQGDTPSTCNRSPLK